MHPICLQLFLLISLNFNYNFFFIQYILHQKSKHCGASLSHPSSSRAFQHYQVCNTQVTLVWEISPWQTKHNNLLSFIDRFHTMKHSAHILYTKLTKKVCCFMLFHFCHHTEELAVLCGLINTDPNIPLCIVNLLQFCGSSPHFHGVQLS
jgi:hypothetical protein